MLCVLEHQCQNRSLRHRKTEPFFPLPEKLVEWMLFVSIFHNPEIVTLPDSPDGQKILSFWLWASAVSEDTKKNVCEGSYSILCSSPAVKQRPAAWGFGEMFTVWRYMCFFRFMSFAWQSKLTHIVYTRMLNYYFTCTIDEYLMNKCFFTDVARSNGIMQS